MSTEVDNYTLKITDANSVIQFVATTFRTIVVPTNTQLPFAVGTQISIAQTGVGQAAIAGATGVTLLFPNDMLPKTRRQYSTISLVKVSLNQWLVFGDLAAVS